MSDERLSQERLIDTARRLGEALRPGDLDETLRRVTAAAVEVLPDVRYSSITIKHSDGSLGTVAPTAELLRAVDAAQYELREGPCYLAATETAHVIAPNLAADERFPKYGPLAVSYGIRAQAGIRLFDTPKSQGALNLYSTKVGAFEDFESLAALFSHQAGVAIAYASEVQSLNDALRTRKTIGQAIGIVMERYGLNEERAFAFLTRLSQHRNVKLRLVATELIAASDHRADDDADTEDGL
jgi:ANTAR domain/GAF domain